MVDRLYHTDITSDLTFELDVDTLLDISSGGVASPAADPLGIGGAGTRLYTVDNTGTDRIYELDPDSFLDISGGGVTGPGGTPGGAPQSIGGGATRLYLTDSNVGNRFEIDPDTLLDLSSGGVANPAGSRGIGGLTTTDVISLSVNAGTDVIHDVDKDTLALSNQRVPGVGSTIGDIGGTSTRLYLVEVGSDTIFELDPVTKADISAGGVNSPAADPQGIGGIDFVATAGDGGVIDPIIDPIIDKVFSGIFS